MQKEILQRLRRMDETLQRLRRMDELIRVKSTGTPAELAGKVGISERSTYAYLRLMKELGAPVEYCRERRSYIYKEEGQFLSSFYSGWESPEG